MPEKTGLHVDAAGTDGFRSASHNDIIKETDDVTNQAHEDEVEALLQYRHLEEGAREEVDAILRGQHLLDPLPKLRSRVVRIFISSTFTDMQQERNALMANIYPKLKSYCRERYGIEFQVVDLRWGVSSEAEDCHMATEICMQEIRSCQQNSIGPNFVAFVGQKYGYCALPADLTLQQFKLIREFHVERDNDVTILDQWYMKDSNYLFGGYLLQPISKVLGENKKKWPRIQEKLQSMLKEAAAHLQSAKLLEDGFLQNLNSSVTEMEVSKGVLMLPRSGDRDRNCICFIRDISDVYEKSDRSKVWRFIDQDGKSEQVNSEKKEAVEALSNKIPRRLKAENIFKNTIKWSDPHGVDPQDHKEYLDSLCIDFYSKVRSLIDVNVAHQETLVKDELYEDVLQHWVMAKSRSDSFLGREMELIAIKEYILGSTNQPLVLFGESGHGKTSIMAKAAVKVQRQLLEHNASIPTTTILRFCGTSPGSSNIRQLLKSLCHQIAYATDGSRRKIPDDDKGMKKYFNHMVQHAEFKGLVVIFLDALDQLDPSDNAYIMDWLPSQIANNVKIIVSTLPNHGNILLRLKNKITSNDNFIEVCQMKPGLCYDILHAWLSERHRTLQFNQWKVVKQAFSQCALPLYAKLMFEEVKTWKSYTEMDSSTLVPCVRNSINCLFDRLESLHGQTLISHALSYLTASRSGISETEMEDILSLDDRVLNSVFVYWLPPIRRIPSITWPRIKHDIGCYLVEREKDETTVEFWYHRQFREVATERYLQDSHARYIHSNMADYYIGMWSGMTKKPFSFEQCLMERLGIKEPVSSALRYVPEQPLEFQTFTDGNKRYNLRKLCQLPYHLANSNRVTELGEHVLFNYEWLHTKLQACSVQEVISDFNLVDNREINLVGDVFRMAEAALVMDPKMLGPEISGRLLPHYNTFPNIQKLIDRCDLAALEECPFVPHWQSFTTSGGPLEYECEAEPDIKSNIDIDIINCEDTLLMTAKPFHSAHMKIWDIVQGETRPGITLEPRSDVFPTLDGKFINVFKNSRFLQTYQLDSAGMYGEVEFGHGNIGQVALANKYFAFCLVQAAGPVVIDIEARALLHRFQYQSDVVTVSRDDRYLLCNTGQCISMHEFPLMERKLVAQTPDAPTKITFTKDNRRFYAMLKNKMLQSYSINLARRTAKGKSIVHDIEMQSFSLSYSEDLLLIRCSRRLYVFDTDDDTVVARIQKMPPGVFMERFSTFVGACFTKDDSMVIGIRNTYMGIWESRTGKPLRLLQSTASPIVKMFSSPVVNKVITLQQNNHIQVWNLNNLDSEVQYFPAVVRGKVNDLSVGKHSSKIIFCGAHHAEAKVYDMDTGEVEMNLVHSEEVGKVILEVIMSPQGKFAVTRCENSDHPEDNHPWPLLREDKLWKIDTGELLCTVTRSRYVTFSSVDDMCVFFKARMYSKYDWSVNSYDAMVFNLEIGEVETLVHFPDGDIIGLPVISGKGAHLSVIMQQCSREIDASYNEKSRSYEIKLCALSFHKQWRGIKYIDIHDIWSGMGDTDNFLDVKVVNEENLLLTYAEDCPYYSYNKDGSIDRYLSTPKGAFLYHLKKNCFLKRFENFLHRDSNVEHLKISQLGSVVLDDKLTAFDILSNTAIHHLNIADAVDLASMCLILDGRYVAGISANHREVLVFRTSDGIQKGRLFIHGYASHLQVGSDDRSLVIGCQDGRIVVFAVVLDLCSPVQEYINKLPSRQPIQIAQKSCKTTGVEVIDRDVSYIDKSLPELKQLSIQTRNTIIEKQNKPPSFETVSNGVALLTQYNRSKSRACVIQ